MKTKEAAYKKISELVDRFDEQFASYKKPDYNETQTRCDCFMNMNDKRL